MMAQVVAGIIDALKAGGIDCQDIGFKDLIDGTINLKKPVGINITVEQAPNAQLVTMFEYKWRFYISLKIVIQWLPGGNVGQGRRKEKIYETIESVTQILLLQKLGLQLENPITPLSFRNITTPKLAKAGYQVYEVTFWSTFITEYQEPQDKDGGIFASIDNKYWILPNDSTNFSDSTHERAEDLITLSI